MSVANDDVPSVLKAFDSRMCFLCYQRLIKEFTGDLKIVRTTSGFHPFSCTAVREVCRFHSFKMSVGKEGNTTFLTRSVLSIGVLFAV